MIGSLKILVVLLFGCVHQAPQLPDIRCRGDGVYVSDSQPISWDGVGWRFDHNGGVMTQYVRMSTQEHLHARYERTTGCDFFESFDWGESVASLSPLTLSSSLGSEVWEYDEEEGGYRPAPTESVPFDEGDQLHVAHGDEVEIIVAAPPTVGWDAFEGAFDILGAREGLDTLVQIPHDDFDALLVRAYSGEDEERLALCFYGRADFERSRGVNGHPILAPVDRDIFLDGVTSEEDVGLHLSLVNLELSDELWPGERSVPVIAGRGVAFDLDDLL